MHFCFSSQSLTFMQCAWCMEHGAWYAQYRHQIFFHTLTRWLDTDPRKMIWNKNDINIYISTNRKYALYELDEATKVTFCLSRLSYRWAMKRGEDREYRLLLVKLKTGPITT